MIHEGLVQKVLLEGGSVCDNPEGFKDGFSQKLAFLRAESMVSLIGP